MTIKPYKSLDAWRGIAALAVVLHHISSVAVGRYPVLASSSIYSGLQFGYLGVQMFFVISGYCIATAAVSSLRRQGSWKYFMTARVKRVFPAFWFSMAFIAAISIVMTALVKSGHLHASRLGSDDLLHKSIVYFVSNLTLTNCLTHQPFLSIVCWTLCYEIAFYVLVAVMVVIAGRTGSRDSLFVCANILTLVSLGLLIVTPRFDIYPFDLWPEFGLGILVYQILQNPGQRSTYVWAASVFGLFLTFVIARSMPMSVMAEPSRLTFFVCIAFAALLIAIYRYDDQLTDHWFVKPLAIVGAFSYSLYLTHFTTLGIANQMSHILKLPVSMNYLLSGAEVAAAVVVAWAFYSVFEKPFLSKRAKAPAAVPLPDQSPQPVGARLSVESAD